MITDTEYKKRVIDFFKRGVALTEPNDADWDLLGHLFLEASQDRYQGGMEIFDKRILTSTELAEGSINLALIEASTDD